MKTLKAGCGVFVRQVLHRQEWRHTCISGSHTAVHSPTKNPPPKKHKSLTKTTHQNSPPCDVRHIFIRITHCSPLTHQNLPHENHTNRHNKKSKKSTTQNLSQKVSTKILHHLPQKSSTKFQHQYLSLHSPHKNPSTKSPQKSATKILN